MRGVQGGPQETQGEGLVMATIVEDHDGGWDVVTLRKDVECYVCGRVLKKGTSVYRCILCKRVYCHKEGC